MMKRAFGIALLSASLLAWSAACSNEPDPATTPGDARPPDTVVTRQADIYEAIARKDGLGMGDMWIKDQICADAGATPAPGGCEPMSPALIAALQARFPEARFTSDPSKMQERLINKGGVVIYEFGPIEGSGGRVEVPATYWCGGLCALGTTHVVELVDGYWQVTGSTGPIMMA